MGFRFFRRVKLAPGLSLNLSKRGGSLSFGPRGAKLTLGTSGVRATGGIPGTGLYYTEKLGSRRGRRRRKGARAQSNGRGAPVPTVRAQDRLDLNFFERLFVPKDEEEFVDGMRDVVLGDEKAAYTHMCNVRRIADGAFMAGMLALKLERFDEARRHLEAAYRDQRSLGTYFAKYGIDATVTLPLTERISAQVCPSHRGVLLALAEAHQGLKQWREAADILRELHAVNQKDFVVLLSLCEMLMTEVGDAKACKEVVRITKSVDNEDEVRAAILLWKGTALRQLELHTAARDTLTAALRRKKDRDPDLLRAIRYERMLVYEAMGEDRRVREELERLYAKAPDYEDVASRLGLASR